MFTHIVLGTNDIQASKVFYNTALATIGHKEAVMKPDGSGFSFITNHGALTITKPLNGKEATFGNGTTIGLVAQNESQVDTFYKVSLENGGECAGEPKTKVTPFGMKIRIAYVRDITGNKIAISFMFDKKD